MPKKKEKKSNLKNNLYGTRSKKTRVRKRRKIIKSKKDNNAECNERGYL